MCYIFISSKKEFNMDKQKAQTIRARIEPSIKKDFDEWCKSHELLPSQVLRMLIKAHLHNPKSLLKGVKD
jgi:hypothetical protein